MCTPTGIRQTKLPNRLPAGASRRTELLLLLLPLLLPLRRLALQTARGQPASAPQLVPPAPRIAQLRRRPTTRGESKEQLDTLLAQHSQLLLAHRLERIYLLPARGGLGRRRRARARVRAPLGLEGRRELVK